MVLEFNGKYMNSKTLGTKINSDWYVLLFIYGVVCLVRL